MKKRIFFLSLLVLLLASGIAVSGCDYITGEALTITPPSPPVINNVTPERAYQFFMVSSFPIYVIDVRTPEEYAAGHIVDAINIDVDSPDFKSNIDRLDRSAVYIVYCRNGIRSAAASKIMAEYGFRHINSVTGGFADLAAQGLPVEK